MEEEFDSTVTWALEEEKIRVNRGQGISSFYLIILSFVLLLICFFIFYFSKEPESLMEALKMMQDPKNIYDDNFDSYVE